MMTDCPETIDGEIPDECPVIANQRRRRDDDDKVWYRHPLAMQWISYVVQIVFFVFFVGTAYAKTMARIEALEDRQRTLAARLERVESSAGTTSTDIAELRAIMQSVNQKADYMLRRLDEYSTPHGPGQ